MNDYILKFREYEIKGFKEDGISMLVMGEFKAINNELGMVGTINDITELTTNITVMSWELNKIHGLLNEVVQEGVVSIKEFKKAYDTIVKKSNDIYFRKNAILNKFGYEGNKERLIILTPYVNDIYLLVNNAVQSIGFTIEKYEGMSMGEMYTHSLLPAKMMLDIADINMNRLVNSKGFNKAVQFDNE